MDFNDFAKHIEGHFPFLKEGRLLIAISGGIDSCVLAHLCHKMGLNIALAHCNFNLRGEESDADEDFILQLAEALDVEVFVQRFDTETYANNNKRSIQMAARELRYNWFTELAQQLQFDFILTAHHADDDLETFLINFSRGTGLEGLTGIPKENGKFMRPLLKFSSEDIKAYAENNKVKWREDSSNTSVKYLRNKLRHEVIPILKEINPSLLQSFQTTLENLKGSSAIIKASVDTFLDSASETISENEVRFKISAFKKYDNPKPYLYETLKHFGFTEWNDVLNLLDAETGKHLLSRTHRLIKNRDYVLLSPITKMADETIVIDEYIKQIETPLGVLFFDEADAMFNNEPKTIYIDKDILEFPLVLRKKMEGDVFYPLGMTGKKKLSKYFKDEKLSLLDKENTWLLCSGDAIVWVVGKRADARFKVTKATKNILKITLD